MEDEERGEKTEETKDVKEVNKEEDNKTAQQLSKDMKKNEFIDWRNHPTLNEVTKTCIEQYEGEYKFEDYLDERSKKDAKFINPN